jgi:hypothetical protein
MKMDMCLYVLFLVWAMVIGYIIGLHQMGVL